MSWKDRVKLGKSESLKLDLTSLPIGMIFIVMLRCFSICFPKASHKLSFIINHYKVFGIRNSGVPVVLLGVV